MALLPDSALSVGGVLDLNAVVGVQVFSDDLEGASGDRLRVFIQCVAENLL